MYEVVLLDRDTDEQIGEIGRYNSFEEAHYEAHDYNRKGDRHRGKATVQGILGEKPRIPVQKNPHRQGLRLNTRTYNNVRPKETHYHPPRNRQPIKEMDWQNDENAEILRNRNFTPPRQRSLIQQNPEPVSQPKPFVCIYDSRKNRSYVLANKQLQPLLMANPYQSIIGEGSIVEMVKLRDQKNKGDI